MYPIQPNRLNSNVKIDAIDELLNSANAMDILRGYDLILDATDNVATRYLLNDACVMLRKPLVSGSALQVNINFHICFHVYINRS